MTHAEKAAKSHDRTCSQQGRMAFFSSSLSFFLCHKKIGEILPYQPFLIQDSLFDEIDRLIIIMSCTKMYVMPKNDDDAMLITLPLYFSP